MSATCRFLAMLAGACLFITLGLAQIRSSVITGIITDASGAVIPDVAVVVKNEDTNVALEVGTNTAGEYTVPYLAAGRYSVTVRATGFQAYRKSDIVMGTATTLRVDATLATGSVQTSIDVYADAAVLQTENSRKGGPRCSFLPAAPIADSALSATDRRCGPYRCNTGLPRPSGHCIVPLFRRR